MGKLVVVVGSGGVGKTTLAAALGVLSARGGSSTLVMTFDPSLRLKDALGVGDEARVHEVRVPLKASGTLDVSLLDPRDTFDRLVARYAPDEAARERILHNRFYDQLSGTLAGIMEYMAVERLFEVASERRWERVILDTPPTRQAIDFLQAPERIVGFLDSGALRVALKPWFDAEGRLRPTRRLGLLGRNLEAFLDRIVGLEVLRDMAEFFQAFAPLYEGFRSRATEVQALLRAPETEFVLVTGPGEDGIPDTMFFARRLVEAGHRLGPVVVNRVHPPVAKTVGDREPGQRPSVAGLRLLRWLAEHDRRGLTALRGLMGSGRQVIDLPLLPVGPTDLGSLAGLATLLGGRLAARAAEVPGKG
ncbi:MAG: ArsA family ATPase [Acidobacteriota bacterium]